MHFCQFDGGLKLSYSCLKHVADRHLLGGFNRESIRNSLLLRKAVRNLCSHKFEDDMH